MPNNKIDKSKVTSAELFIQILVCTYYICSCVLINTLHSCIPRYNSLHVHVQLKPASSILITLFFLKRKLLALAQRLDLLTNVPDSNIDKSNVTKCQVDLLMYLFS